MNAEEFNKVLTDIQDKVQSLLGSKAEEYASDKDRLHNFKIAAAMQGITPRQALAGMMAKHTTSVYDMAMSTDLFPEFKWDEKIIDHINYLILLAAVVKEENDAATAWENFTGNDVMTPEEAHRIISEQTLRLS